MNPKPRPNDAIYIDILRRMSGAQRLAKAFELNEFARSVFRAGLRRRNPELDEAGIRRLEAEHFGRCHKRIF